MSTGTTSRKSFRVDREELVAALKTVEPLTDPRSPASLFRNIKLQSRDGRLVVEAHSHDADVSVELEAEGQLAASLPHRAIYRAIKAFKGDQLSLRSPSAKALEIKSGQRSMTLEATKPEGGEGAYAEIGDRKTSFTAPGPELAELLALAARCAGTDQTRPLINTVAVDVEHGHPTLVATDSYRLVVLRLDDVNADAVEAPQLFNLDAAKALARDLKTRKPEEVEVEAGSAGTSVSYDGVRWFIRNVEGQYPHWRSLLPGDGKRVLLDREELGEALKAVNAVAVGDEPMRVELGEKISVTYRAIDVGVLTEALPESSWEGEPMAIGLHPQRLADLLPIIEGEKIEGWITTPLRGVIFESPGRKFVVMPIRLNEIDPKSNGAVSKHASKKS